MIPVASSSSSDGCIPVSSNCIIWQGPDIPCINLCTGDSVSDVIYKLATELCTLLDQTNLTGLDLSCLELSPSEEPQDLQEFLQLIIDKLCSLGSRCTALETGSGTGGSTTINVTVAPCHIAELGAVEVPVGTYAEFLGTKICDLVTSITTIQSTIVNHENRITVLENNTGGSTTLPQVTPACVLPAVPTDMDVVLAAVEQEFCDLKEATGEAGELITSIGYQCANLNNAPRQSGTGVMSNIPGWKNPVVNLSDSVTNLWLVICDMRAALQNVLDNCCNVDCNDIIIDITPSVNQAGDTLTVDFTGTVIPQAFYSCHPLGAFLEITDALGAIYTTRVDIASFVSQSTQYTLDITTTNLNQGSSLSVRFQTCFTDGTTTCENAFNYNISGSVECPEVTLYPTQTEMGWSFLHTLGSTVSYNVELLLNGQYVANMYQLNQPNGTLSGTFTNLTSGANYQIRVTILVPGSAAQECEPINAPTDDPTEYFWQVTPCDVEAPVPSNNAVRTFDPTIQLGDVVTLTGATHQGYCYTISDIGVYPNAVLIAGKENDCNGCLT